MLRLFKVASVVVTSGILITGSCLPDNLWASIAGYTLIDGTTAAVRDAVLGAIGL